MSKYGNKKATRGNLTFDSQKEAARFDELILLLKAGKITNLKLQPEFTLQEAFTTPGGEKVRAIKYRADFEYTQAGCVIVEDVKGVRTKEYLLKRKMMLDRGIQIHEV